MSSKFLGLFHEMREKICFDTETMSRFMRLLLDFLFVPSEHITISFVDFDLSGTMSIKFIFHFDNCKGRRSSY